MDSPLTEQQLLAWFALLRAPGVGCQTLNPLISHYPDVEQLIRTPPDECPDQLKNYLRRIDWSLIEKDLAWLNQSGNDFVTINDNRYPHLLRTISNPPSALFLHGDIELLDLPQIAVVGSRTPSHSGAETAREFARYLGKAGFTITSGLALGIDTQAHQGALDSQAATIAVTGTGLDRVYPAKNRDLAHKIAESGLLISEFPPGTPPTPANFPRRNRIISGLSIGTLVVEAALKSGSLITARTAGEQGREVFAIPGSIHNPLARGCHRLIREGAKLVETGQDLIEELSGLLSDFVEESNSPETTHLSQETTTDNDNEQQLLLDALGYDPATTDQLVERSGLPAANVSSMLLLLELQGVVSSEVGGTFTRLGKQSN